MAGRLTSSGGKNTPRTKPVVEKKICVGKNCKKEQPLASGFYSANIDIFPDGKLHLCRGCVEEYILKKGFSGLLTILRVMDKPFLQEIYKDDYKDYIRQINSLPQYRGMTFDNSVFENKSNSSEIKIENANSYIGDTNPNNAEKFYSKKWLGEYTESEINYLDEYYKGLDGDFKIITTNHKDYAKKIAKASLHMDRCFEDMLAGISGADKKYKEARETFDTLSKSAQFSESQRGQNDVSLGCFGRVFDMVETKTYIPEHIVTNPDDIDKMIEDFKHIFKSI